MALLLGAVVFLSVVSPATPRTVTVRVRLANFREGAQRARALQLRFERDGQIVQQVHSRLDAHVPLRYERELSLVPGAYQAVVSVELAEQVLTRTQTVTVTAEEPVDVQAPSLP